MAKAVAKAKKMAAKSKPSKPVRAKAAPPASTRKALKKSPAKPAAKAAKKPVSNKPAVDVTKAGKWVFTFGDGKAEGKAGLRDLLGGKGQSRRDGQSRAAGASGFTIPTRSAPISTRTKRPIRRN
jgi:pyruvate,orthophosphate dikinase